MSCRLTGGYSAPLSAKILNILLTAALGEQIFELTDTLAGSRPEEMHPWGHGCRARVYVVDGHAGTKPTSGCF